MARKRKNRYTYRQRGLGDTGEGERAYEIAKMMSITIAASVFPAFVPHAAIIGLPMLAYGSYKEDKDFLLAGTLLSLHDIIHVVSSKTRGDVPAK